jgi:O-antigen/teichoic acid export membrane protein
LPDNASTPPDGERARNIVQGIGLLALQNLATSVLAVIFLVAIVRLLPGAGQYGIYSAVLVTVTIASTFAGFGLSLAATRFVALLWNDNEQSSWVVARKTVLLSLVLAGVTTAFYLALSPLLSIYFTKSTSWTWAFLLGGAWLFSVSLANTFQGILQGLKKYVQLAKIIFVTRLVMVVVSTSVLYFDRSIGIPLLGWALFYSLILVWIFALVGKELTTAIGSFSYSTILRYAMPLGVAGIIAVFATSSDSVIVGGYLNPSSLGIYQAAITISSVLGVVALTPLTTALFPELSSSQNHGDVSYGIRLAFRFATLAILPASLFVASVSSQLLELFTGGGVYLAGSLTLQLIGIFYVFIAIQTILLVLLQAVGKTLQVIVVGVITAATDIGVAMILVPHFGLAGAVASKVAVSLDGTFVSLYLTRIYLKNLDKSVFYVKGAIAATIPFVIVFVLSLSLSSRVLTLIPYAPLYVLLFLVCVKWLRLISPEDRTFLRHTLPGSLRKLADYV